MIVESVQVSELAANSSLEDLKESVLALSSLDDDQLQSVLWVLADKRLERVSKFCGLVKKAKYNHHRHRDPLYGRLSRAFSYHELMAFFRGFRNKNVLPKFAMMLLFGLRVGELSDVEWLKGQRVLLVKNHKCSRVDQMPVPSGWEWLLEHFFSLQSHSPAYLRKCFRTVCNELGDDFSFSYGVASNGRNLRLKGTHSLRHSCGTLFHKHVIDPLKVAVLLRHKKTSQFGVTGTYLHYTLEQQREDMEAAFKVFIELFEELLR